MNLRTIRISDRISELGIKMLDMIQTGKKEEAGVGAHLETQDDNRCIFYYFFYFSQNVIKISIICWSIGYIQERR
jgi:hypothetical protein